MILSVNDLTFNYPCRAVLEGVSFSICEGELLAVLGVNGAGKSTLLKCINRILKPCAGAVYIRNEEMDRLSNREIAKRIGYVPQQQENTCMTVYDAVLLGRKPHIQWEASEKDYEIAQNAIKALELEEYSLRYLNELSGGERQKVVIARALAQQPKLLLLDEPISSLDIKNQIEVMKIIKNIAKNQKVGAIVSIHDLNIAIRFADKFLLLKNKEIFAAGGLEVMTSQNIESVYSVSVKVKNIDGIPVVIPI